MATSTYPAPPLDRPSLPTEEESDSLDASDPERLPVTGNVTSPHNTKHTAGRQTVGIYAVESPPTREVQRK
jgi:hypothetical protein